MEYREDLDNLAQATRKKDDELVILAPSCHPEARPTAYYWLEKGCVVLVCGECGKAYAQVSVQERPLAIAPDPEKDRPKPRRRKAGKKTASKVSSSSGKAMVPVKSPQKMGESARKNRARVR